MKLSNKAMGVFSAELIGTALLATMVLYMTGGNVANLGLTGLIILGLVATTLVFVLGGASGAHFNPALTVAMLAMRKIKTSMAVVYVAAQLVGAIVALRLFEYLQGAELSEAASLADLSQGQLFTAEALGAAILAMGFVLVCKHQKSIMQVSAFIVGLSFMTGLAIASIGGGGMINPAIALSMDQFTLTPILAPVVGAVIGMFVAGCLGSMCNDKK